MTIPKSMAFRDHTGRTWEQPISVRVQREIALAYALDDLQAAVGRTRADVAALPAEAEGGDPTSNGGSSPAALLASVKRLVQAADGMIDAARTLLVV